MLTIRHNSLQNVRLSTNATPTPASPRRMRERSSSRCSRNDIRSIPSSSSSRSESVGGGGGGVEAPDPPALGLAGTSSVELEAAGVTADEPVSPYAYGSS